MKFWEVILYALVGGISELLPISFSGHSAMLQNVFHMSSLNAGDGFYVRAGICIGIIIALCMVFRNETRESKLILRKLRGRDTHRRRTSGQEQGIKIRVFLLSFFAFIPMLFSLIFMGKAENNGSLIHITIFFVLNGFLIFLCTRGPVGQRGDREVTLYDSLLIGVLRMLSVFPGLSSVGTSLCIGRARGMSQSFNIRFTYMLTMGFQLVGCVYYLFRGFIFGSFTGRSILSFILSIVISSVAAFFSMLYFKNVIMKDKLKMFVYYCFDAAAIAFIIAIING